nr:glucosaminidase domain-containing protein [Enterococcus sp. DIV0849a]
MRITILGRRIKREGIHMKVKKSLKVVMGLIFSVFFSPVFAMTEPLVELELQTGDFEQTKVSADANTANKEDKLVTHDSAIEQNQDASRIQEDFQAASDSVNDVSENLEEEPKKTIQDLPEIVIRKNQITEEFIEVIRELAEKIAFEYDLYASVMIAQAILESASGSSSLSIAPNYNLFGIKGDYKGMTVVMKTQEDDGIGNLFTIDSRFRKYPSYKEALEDYASLLKNGLVENLEFYKGTWKSEARNYQEVTTFLTGRYATDSRYAEKLNQLISVYELTRYDEYKKDNVKEQLGLDKNTIVETIVVKQGINVFNINKVWSLMLKDMQKRQVQKQIKLIKLLVDVLSYYVLEILKLINV